VLVSICPVPTVVALLRESESEASASPKSFEGWDTSLENKRKDNLYHIAFCRGIQFASTKPNFFLPWFFFFSQTWFTKGSKSLRYFNLSHLLIVLSKTVFCFACFCSFYLSASPLPGVFILRSGIPFSNLFYFRRAYFGVFYDLSI